MEAQVSLIGAFSSSAFFGLVSYFPLDNTPYRSGEFASQSSTPTPWSFNSTFGAFGSVGRCQILLEKEISIFKKLASRKKHEMLKNFLVDGCDYIIIIRGSCTKCRIPIVIVRIFIIFIIIFLP